MAKYKIVTPEQVHFHYNTAGLMSRAMAWALDQVFVTIARILIYQLFSSAMSVGTSFIILGFFIIDFGYYVCFELYWAGQSPGKKIFKIRVISASGGRLRFPAVLIRNLIRPLDSLPMAMGAGGITAFIDPLSRRFGDMVAETLVVKDSQLAIPEEALAQQARDNTFQADPALRSRILARVTKEERNFLLDLMLKRDEMEQSIREELYSQAAQYCRNRYALPEGLEYLSDEQTVLNVALVIQGVKLT